MERKIAIIAVAVVCVGVIAVAGVFLPSQSPQRTEENKTWQFKQDIQGTNAQNVLVSIESAIWRVNWFAFVWENSDNEGWFRFDVSQQVGDVPIASGWMVNGWPLGDTEYIIGGGTFVVQIQAENADWYLYIYEYR